MFGKSKIPVEFTDSAITMAEIEDAESKLKTLSRHNGGGGGCLGLFAAIFGLVILCAFVGFMGWGGFNMVTTGSILPPTPTPLTEAPTPTPLPRVTAQPTPETMPEKSIAMEAAPANELSLSSLSVVKSPMTSPVRQQTEADSHASLVSRLGLTTTLSLSEALSLARSLTITDLTSVARAMAPQANMPQTANPIALLPTNPTTATATATHTKTDTITQTASISPTRPTYGQYELIAHTTSPEGLYSYVSGWIVESDGQTTRPVPVELRFNGGVMRYPRPNNTDVATGRYEFLVSPGEYWLSVNGSEALPLIIGPNPTRHEISFRYTGQAQATTPARSTPWAGRSSGQGQAQHNAQQGGQAQPQGEPTPTPTEALPKTRSIYLPLIMSDLQTKRTQNTNTSYLPIVIGGNQ